MPIALVLLLTQFSFGDAPTSGTAANRNLSCEHSALFERYRGDRTTTDMARCTPDRYYLRNRAENFQKATERAGDTITNLESRLSASVDMNQSAQCSVRNLHHAAKEAMGAANTFISEQITKSNEEIARYERHLSERFPEYESALQNASTHFQCQIDARSAPLQERPARLRQCAPLPEIWNTGMLWARRECIHERCSAPQGSENNLRIAQQSLTTLRQTKPEAEAIRDELRALLERMTGKKTEYDGKISQSEAAITQIEAQFRCPALPRNRR